MKPILRVFKDKVVLHNGKTLGKLLGKVLEITRLVLNIALKQKI